MAQLNSLNYVIEAFSRFKTSFLLKNISINKISDLRIVQCLEALNRLKNGDEYYVSGDMFKNDGLSR